MLNGKRSSYCYPTNHTTTTASHSICWIDLLLETPIEDHRKYAMWRIIAPYFINVRKLAYEEACSIIKDWLNKCGSVRGLDFNPDHRIKDKLKDAIKIGYFPVSLNNLKEENPELYTRVTKPR